MTTAARPYAMVTGASSGIGRELAREFAEHGFDLLITAPTPDIEVAAAELRGSGAMVETVIADLATFDGVERLWSSASRTVDAVAINAGVGVGGRFVETELAEELTLVELNVAGSVHLAKLAAAAMTSRGAGKMLFTSSIASTQPSPYEAVYAASKSFVQSFAEALREEVKGDGVTVTALMPGPTETNFFHRAGMDDTKLGQSAKDDAAKVAAAGFKALMSGANKTVASSLTTKLTAAAAAVTPDVLKAKAHALLSKPGSAG